MNEIEKLNQRIAALESRIASADDKKDDDKVEKKEASEREVLASEIAALERKLGAEECDEKDEKKDDEKTASLTDPNGVEEQITQKRFTEVEDLEHGTELTTEDSTLDAAPTGYVARLKQASARLDVVATYLEKSGRKELAFRVDKIADAIDQRLNSLR